MDWFITILVLLVLAAVVVVGELYLALDKHKMRAESSAAGMTEGLDVWVRNTAALVAGMYAGTETARDIGRLSAEYFGIGRRRKYGFRRISVVNSMAGLVFPLMPGGFSPEDGQTVRERKQAVDSLQILRSGYNQSVGKLHSLLGKKMYAWVGRLFRVTKPEVLEELPVDR